MTALPEGWTAVPLASLCFDVKADIVDGPFGSNLKRSDYVTSGVPVLKIQNVKPNAIHLKKMDFVTEAKYSELERHAFRDGDIVMTKLGDPLGVAAKVVGVGRGLIVADLVRLRVQGVDTDFLCHQLNAPAIQRHINSLQKGTTRPRVNLDMIRNLPIVLPSLDEQQRIVAILEDHLGRIDSGNNSLCRASTLAKRLVDGSAAAIWEESERLGEFRPIHELGRLFTGSTPSTKQPEFYGDAVPFVTPSDIGNGRKVTQWSRGLSTLGAEHARLTDAPSVLAVCIGSLGKIGWAEERLATNQQVNVLQPHEEIAFAPFLASLMASPTFQRIMWAEASSTTLPILNKGRFGRIEIPIPGIDVQEVLLKRHFEWASAAEKAARNSVRMAEQAGRARSAILAAAFSGQLTRESISV